MEITWLELIKEGLSARGFDGLYNPGVCACLIGDLMPCGEISPDCLPGVRKNGTCDNCTEDNPCAFHVGQKED